MPENRGKSILGSRNNKCNKEKEKLGMFKRGSMSAD